MSGLSHIGNEGEARMVDVSRKSVTSRVAVAEGIVRMRAETRAQITEDKVAKGSVLEVARIAGIQAAKRTGDMIPLCHPLPLDGVRVDFQWLDESEPAEARLRIEAEAKVTAKTGVEMEALSAVAVAALTIYDMVKAVDKGLVIEVVRLLEKRGGKSGDYHA